MTVDPGVVPGLLLLAAKLLTLAGVGYVMARVVLRQTDDGMALAQGLVIGPALWGLLVNFMLPVLPGRSGALAGWIVILVVGIGLACRTPRALRLSPRRCVGFAAAALAVFWAALAVRQMLPLPDMIHVALAASIQAGGSPSEMPWNPGLSVPYHYGPQLLTGLLAPPVGPDLAFTIEVLGAFVWMALAMIVGTALLSRGGWTSLLVLTPLLITTGAWTLIGFDVLPAESGGSYDVRDVLAAVADDGVLLEPHPFWGANLVTALASFGGRPVGIVANQPQSLAGTLDITGSRKGARFVAFCDAFNLPLVTFVDTSGFYPGKDLEWRGMIRYGAQMAFAYARATVPRVNVTLRKSYGGAYIVMDSKTMGNDLALAWPTAEIAVMGAKGAVGILHRSATDAERAVLETAYEQRLLNPYIAAERGAIDSVIEPADTRREICAALEMLVSKRERLPMRRHDNSPL